MSVKKHSSVGLQIDAPSPTPEQFNYDTDMVNLPKPLNLEEKKFLLAVERGDVPNVKRILQKAIRNHSININCVDSFGRGALTLAIDGENLEIVELLIIMGLETKDALLEAINQEFVEAVELLLEHEELIHKDGEAYSWQRVDHLTAQYSPEITPLILAAHRNNYEIIKLLLDRGATLPAPHDVKCPCDDCIRKSSEDSLRYSLSRVSEYRALASPSLIALSSNDPLQTAFQLSWELRNLAFAEHECKAEYLELRRQCQKFAVDLLDQTRSSQELAIILNYDPQAPPYMDGDHMKLKRLEMAIDYKQKKFVAHPNIQQLLASLWYEGVPGFRRKKAAQKLFIISKVAMLFPFYCLMYMFFPYCNTAKIIRKPFMKFLIHASSYLFFLFILILVSQRAEVQLILMLGTEKMKASLQESLKKQRGNAPTPLELLVVLYVIGFIWEETMEIVGEGSKSYLRNLWNFIDFSRNSLYCFVFLFRGIAYVQQMNQINQDPATAFIPREDWDDFDPQAEGLFAAANVFSALKLVHLFSINPHLGPLQVSLGRMVIDIVKFFFIYSLVLFAFACGLNQLLWYYADLEKAKCYSLPEGLPDWNNEGDACMKWRRFGNLFESSQSLFWASFGMVGLENFELLGIKTYTRFWGLLMFGSYSVINVIVLLNLLIAMMSNSYALIEQHSDTEWKFARTKLWMSYFEESATLPPPFNIFPTMKNFVKCCRQKTKYEMKRESTIRRKEERERANRYTNVMRSLVWRYVSSMHRKFEESPVTEDDINEVKGEISTMRYELLEVLNKNGMDVSSADRKEKTVLAKRMKVWERRLMKDFHVAPVEQIEIAEVEEVGESTKTIQESPLERFRRVSKQVASQSACVKWNDVIRSATIEAHSQIGRCNKRESFKNQQNLLKAMEKARQLIERGPMSPSPTSSHSFSYDVMDQTNKTLVQLLKNISEEISEISPHNTLHVTTHKSRSTTPLATLNAQLQTLISRGPSPNPTMKQKGRSVSPNPLAMNSRSHSLEGSLSPPLKASPATPKSPSPTTSILKNRSATPDSRKSPEDTSSNDSALLTANFTKAAAPIIKVDEPLMVKPDYPKLIDLHVHQENTEEQCPLKQSAGNSVKVIKRKAPAPRNGEDISVLRPAPLKIQNNQGMLPPPPSKDEQKPMQIPTLSTTPATPLMPQKPFKSNSGESLTSSAAESSINALLLNSNESVDISVVGTCDPGNIPQEEFKEDLTQKESLKQCIGEPFTQKPFEGFKQELADPQPSSPAAMIAVGASVSYKSTEKLVPNEEKAANRSPSPICLRPANKIEDVKTIKRQQKQGWL